MKNFGKERDKRRLQASIIELSESLSRSGMTSVIFLPDVNMFTMSGKVIDQLLCAGMIISQISMKTGEEFKEILNEDFFNEILPECKRILEEGTEL